MLLLLLLLLLLWQLLQLLPFSALHSFTSPVLLDYCHYVPLSIQVFAKDAPSQL